MFLIQFSCFFHSTHFNWSDESNSFACLPPQVPSPLQQAVNFIWLRVYVLQRKTEIWLLNSQGKAKGQDWEVWYHLLLKAIWYKSLFTLKAKWSEPLRAGGIQSNITLLGLHGSVGVDSSHLRGQMGAHSASESLNILTEYLIHWSLGICGRMFPRTPRSENPSSSHCGVVSEALCTRWFCIHGSAGLTVTGQLVAQLCPTLWDPTDSSVHGDL